MSFSWTRVAAIVRKEQRDYRRNRFVIVTMTLVPVVFTIAPMIQLFVANATGKSVARPPRAVDGLHAGDPGDRAGRAGRVLGGRRA